MADSFLGNAAEFIVGFILFSVANGIGGMLLIFIVPNITGATEQDQLIAQLIVANYMMHGIIIAVFFWWKKVLGAGYTLSALLHFLLRLNPISVILALFI